MLVEDRDDLVMYALLQGEAFASQNGMKIQRCGKDPISLVSSRKKGIYAPHMRSQIARSAEDLPVEMSEQPLAPLRIGIIRIQRACLSKTRLKRRFGTRRNIGCLFKNGDVFHVFHDGGQSLRAPICIGRNEGRSGNGLRLLV